MSIAQTKPEPDTAEHRSPPSALLIGGAAVMGVDRVPAGRGGRRASARADEDAVTLAAQAAALALPPDLETVGAILFATTTPAYREGAAVQALAELLDLQGDVFALELSASRRDGLAALRLAAALARPGAPVLVCASHAGTGDRTTGDGAVALLVGADGEDGDGGLARLTPVASSAIELRDRWALPGDKTPREADRSFVQTIGTDRLTRDLLAGVPEALQAPAAVVGPDLRGSSTLERALDGAPDTVTSHTGVLGAAHPLLRLLAGLDAPALVVAMSNGLGEAVHVEPTADGAAVAEATREAARNGGAAVERAALTPLAEDFDPYSSGPRSWRDRDVDLRLKGLVGPPEGLSPAPGRRAPAGRVITWTADRVYPASASTELAAVAMDDGGQFFGQVAMGDHVSIGDRVQLVPRRLHHGGGMIQYFWKVTPCR